MIKVNNDVLCPNEDGELFICKVYKIFSTKDIIYFEIQAPKYEHLTKVVEASTCKEIKEHNNYSIENAKADYNESHEDDIVNQLPSDDYRNSNNQLVKIDNTIPDFYKEGNITYNFCYTKDVGKCPYCYYFSNKKFEDKYIPERYYCKPRSVFTFWRIKCYISKSHIHSRCVNCNLHWAHII